MIGGSAPKSTSQIMWDMANEFFRKYTDKARVKFKVDGLKMSFIRSGDDILEVKELIGKGATAKVKTLKSQNDREFVGKYTGGKTTEVKFIVKSTGKALEEVDADFPVYDCEKEVLERLGMLIACVEYQLPDPKKLISDKHQHKDTELSLDVVSDKRIVFIMPKYNGRLLDDVLLGDFPIDKELSAAQMARCDKIALGCARAILKVHERGVVHADVKPDQFIVSDSDEVHLIDYGYSHILPDGQDCVIAMARGAEIYMAPEIASDGQYSFASDLFAFGEVLREFPQMVEESFALLQELMVNPDPNHRKLTKMSLVVDTLEKMSECRRQEANPPAKHKDDSELEEKFRNLVFK